VLKRFLSESVLLTQFKCFNLSIWAFRKLEGGEE